MCKETFDAMNCLIAKVKGKNDPGKTIQITSAYRSEEYQQHLRDIWNWQAGPGQLLSGWFEAECFDVLRAFINERSLHGKIGEPAREICNHTRGLAFDATVKGVEDVDTLAAECKLERTLKHKGEGWHFEATIPCSGSYQP